MYKNKSTFLFSLLFFLIANQLIAQKNNKIDLDALKYLNTFLSEKSIIDDVKGELIYDKYSNSLNYSSTTIIYENPTTETDIYFKMIVNFPIPLGDIKRIVESIMQKDDIIVVQYEFYLNEEVKRTVKTKKKGEWLVEEITNTNKVFFSPEKVLTNAEIEKLKLVIKDIFPGLQIDTERKQY